MTVQELDVRPVPKRQRHPLIFDRFTGLDTGAAFVLVNSHDPKHLREEFERDLPGRYAWEYLETGPTTWRVRITKLLETDLPRVQCNTFAVTAAAASGDATGAIWTLAERERHLDANIIHLLPHARIESHRGPDLDVLMLVVAGRGELRMSANSSVVDLIPGHLTWLPRRSERSIIAGASGLSYLTVHPRRPALLIEPRSVG